MAWFVGSGISILVVSFIPGHHCKGSYLCQWLKSSERKSSCSFFCIHSEEPHESFLPLHTDWSLVNCCWTMPLDTYLWNFAIIFNQKSFLQLELKCNQEWYKHIRIFIFINWLKVICGVKLQNINYSCVFQQTAKLSLAYLIKFIATLKIPCVNGYT